MQFADGPIAFDDRVVVREELVRLGRDVTETPAPFGQSA